jgi:hypothetical protein
MVKIKHNNKIYTFTPGTDPVITKQHLVSVCDAPDKDTTKAATFDENSQEYKFEGRIVRFA